MRLLRGVNACVVTFHPAAVNPVYVWWTEVSAKLIKRCHAHLSIAFKPAGGQWIIFYWQNNCSWLEHRMLIIHKNTTKNFNKSFMRKKMDQQKFSQWPELTFQWDIISLTPVTINRETETSADNSKIDNVKLNMRHVTLSTVKFLFGWRNLKKNAHWVWKFTLCKWTRYAENLKSF